MEAPEEAVGSNDHTQIIKGKRTKRQRPFSQQTIIMTDSSSSEGGDNYTMDLSPATSAELAAAESSTEEEEDMANCLILLAQGQTRDGSKRIGEGSRRFPQAAATATGNGGFYIYECKTCNRSFPSFQALGGHRASHKKPKSTIEEKKIFMGFEEEEGQFNNNIPPFALRIGNRVLCNNNNNKSRVHECSICGSEFSSGQALGGHMRRHRTFISPTVNTVITSEVSQEQSMKTRNVLSLDLNLPAPEEDDKFPFVSQQPPLVFSASALVDCHY